MFTGSFLISGMLIGLLVGWLRKVPALLTGYVKSRFIQTLEIAPTVTGYHEGDVNLILDWINANPNTIKTSYMVGNPSMEDKTAYPTSRNVTIGNGRHYFKHNGKRFWIDITTEKSTTTGAANNVSIKPSITFIVSTWGKDVTQLKSWYESVRYMPTREPKCYTVDVNGRATLLGFCPRRTFDSVIIQKDTMRKIKNRIDHFRNSKEWYLHHSIPYKLVLVFAGVPGTGKTSLIKAIVHEYGLNAYIATSVTQIKSSVDRLASTDSKVNTAIIAEDFDTFAGLGKRKSEEKVEDTTNKTYDEVMGTRDNLSGTSLHTLLNSLDGFTELNGNIILLSTNHPENIDPAIMRKGRVDEIFYINALEDEDIKQYIHWVYNEHVDYGVLDNLNFFPIVGASLQDLFLQSEGDYNKFIQSIPQR